MVNPADHVDVDALGELKDIMEDEFDILIDTFIADSEAKIATLQEVIDAADAEELRKVAHSLKGSSSNICAAQFSELARQLEHMGKEGSTDGAAAIYENLKQEFVSVTETLRNHI
ncbi:MAG: Hpt domain-containing protein [Pseudomonadales bacterium]|nr:Hpt domain-containing protein [Pseudomonadales bacterium]